MLMPPTLPMAMAIPMLLLSLLAPALVWTPSPRELFFLMLDMLDTTVTTLARGLLTLMPTMPLTPMPMDMLPLSPLAPALVLTQSPRDLMPLPRDMFLTMDMLVTTLARGLLMLMPTMLLTPMPMDILPLSPLAPALDLTQSPRDLMLLPRDMSLTMDMLASMAMASNLEKFQLFCCDSH